MLAGNRSEESHFAGGLVLNSADDSARYSHDFDIFHELAGEVTRASQRGAELTGKLLAFSRRQMLSPSRVDIGTLLHSLADMLRRVINTSTPSGVSRSSSTVAACHKSAGVRGTYSWVIGRTIVLIVQHVAERGSALCFVRFLVTANGCGGRCWARC